ncbi:hypothetical protein vseg_015087 [Gypsophila vaccaria]
MATTLSIHPIPDHHHYHNYHLSFPSKPNPPKFQSYPLKPPNLRTSNSTPCFSTPQFHTFLTQTQLTNLNFLQSYTHSLSLPSGAHLTIRPMHDLELDSVSVLLSQSFSDSMSLPMSTPMYLKLLGYLVRQYLLERRGLLPHNVTLVGLLGDSDPDFRELVGTVEVCFDAKGANSNPPTPTAPKNCPYVCNMTVRKEFRRRGIGWHLLKASEELISYMTSTRDVYLHCRLIDTAPFNMYKKAGYEVVKTDSFLVLLTLQRRKHLMCKKLPNLSKPLETVTIEDEDEEEASSLLVGSESEPLLLDEVVQNSLDTDK